MKVSIFIILFTVLSIVHCFAQDENATGKKKSKVGSFLKNAVESTTNLNVSDEMFIVNPIPGFTFQYISCTGSSATQKINLVFVVKHSKENQKVEFERGSATDNMGNTYNGNSNISYGSRQDIRTGIPFRVTYEFSGILSSVKKMEIFVLGVQTKGENTPNKAYDIEFRNIPINWDPQEVETPTTEAQ
jgi:hypothetical protein